MAHANILITKKCRAIRCHRFQNNILIKKTATRIKLESVELPLSSYVANKGTQNQVSYRLARRFNMIWCGLMNLS